jgi:F0F1-type ATP synthase assembly protein I
MKRLMIMLILMFGVYQANANPPSLVEEEEEVVIEKKQELLQLQLEVTKTKIKLITKQVKKISANLENARRRFTEIKEGICYPQEKEKLERLEEEIKELEGEYRATQRALQRLKEKEEEYIAEIAELKAKKEKAAVKPEISEISVGVGVGFLLEETQTSSPRGVLEFKLRTSPIDFYLGIGSFEEYARGDPWFYYYGIETRVLKIGKNLSFPAGALFMEKALYFSVGICCEWNSEELKYFGEGRILKKRGEKKEKINLVFGICYYFE